MLWLISLSTMATFTLAVKSRLLFSRAAIEVLRSTLSAKVEPALRGSLAPFVTALEMPLAAESKASLAACMPAAGIEKFIFALLGLSETIARA